MEFGPLQLTAIERAIICELLVRGPQTPGELRTRCNRMATIADVGEVEVALHSLGENVSGPFVVKLPRLPGSRDSRWAHLLSGDVIITSVIDEPASAAPRSGLAERVQQLEAQVESLQQAMDELQRRIPI